MELEQASKPASDDWRSRFYEHGDDDDVVVEEWIASWNELYRVSCSS